MKKIITVIVLCLALASCAKENGGGTRCKYECGTGNGSDVGF